MECLGPRCASMLLDWLKAQRDARSRAVGPGPGRPPGRQGLLWTSGPYQEEAPAIRSEAELAGALEHLEYAVFRRYQNQLTRAERARLDNTIQNALFKIDRYAERLDEADRAQVEAECRGAPRGGPRRPGAGRAAPPAGPTGRPEARAARLADARGVRGVRRRGVRGARLRGRARRRHRRRGGRPARSAGAACSGSSSASTSAGAWSARRSSRSSSARSTTPGATRASSSPRGPSRSPPRSSSPSTRSS